MEYMDSYYLLSPYFVKAQASLYRLTSDRIIAFSEVPGVKQTEQGVRYGSYYNKQPF
jgi:hypothetical protein